MNGRDALTFEIFVHDDRYSVPTLHLVTVISEAVARDVAEAMLRANPHHLGVELCRDGLQLMALGACGQRRTATIDPLKVAVGG